METKNPSDFANNSFRNVKDDTFPPKYHQHVDDKLNDDGADGSDSGVIGEVGCEEEHLVTSDYEASDVSFSSSSGGGRDDDISFVKTKDEDLALPSCPSLKEDEFSVGLCDDNDNEVNGGDSGGARATDELLEDDFGWREEIPTPSSPAESLSSQIQFSTSKVYVSSERIGMHRWFFFCLFAVDTALSSFLLL